MFMGITFYNKHGTPVAYVDDGKHIFLFKGSAVGYIDNDSIFSYSGKHLGRYGNGWIRDNSGRCVFFTEDATGGPMKPMKSMKPMKGMKSMKPMRPMSSSGWSELSGEQFFG